MSRLLDAAKEVCEWLDGHGVRACLIGALALQRWGEPRLTRDVDLTAVAAIGEEEGVIDVCLEGFRPRLPDARVFALQRRVVVLYARNGVPIDVALGATSFEMETMRRATSYEFEPSCVLPTCSAEDLVVRRISPTSGAL